MKELRKGGAGERALCELAGAEAQRRAEQLVRDRRYVVHAIILASLVFAGVLVLLAA